MNRAARNGSKQLRELCDAVLAIDAVAERPHFSALRCTGSNQPNSSGIDAG
jgi:hypothetical protein